MRKLIGIAVIAVVLSFVVGLADASVGVKEDGEYSGEATYIDVKSGLSSFSSDTISIYTNGYMGGVTTNVSTESTLTSAALAYGIIDVRAGKDKTVGLNDGTAGQMITVVLTTRPTGLTYVISRTAFPATTRATGWATITFDTAGDSITLLYVDDTTGWIIVGNNGCTIA